MNFRKLITYLTMGTAAAMPLAVAQNPTILQGSYISNVFGNSNFIKNPNAQTNIADVTVSNATVTRSTTTPLVATSEFLVTTSTATGSATWSTRTFDAGMKGQNCEARFSYRGFSVGSTTAQILQGANVVAQLTLTASTDPRIASINFPCGDLSSATTFRLQQATASLTGTNEIGGIYVGLATNMANVAQAENLVTAVRGTAQSIPSATKTTFIFNSETLDQLGEYDPTTGIYTAKRSGRYLVTSTVAYTGSSWTVNNIYNISIMKNGSDYVDIYNTVMSTGSYNLQMQVTQTVELVTGDTLKIGLYHTRGSNTDTLASSAYNILSISRFPSSSELVVTPERQNVFAAASWTGGIFFTRTNTTEFTISDAVFSTNRTAFGKAQFTGTANDVAITIPQMPPGTYKIELVGESLRVQQTAAGSLDASCKYYLKDGTNTATGSSVLYGPQYTIDSGAIAVQIVKYTSIADRTFTASAQSVTTNSTACGVYQPKIIITPLDQPSNSALYVEGPVKSAGTGAVLPAGYIGETVSTSSATSGSFATGVTTKNVATITLQPGTWLLWANLRFEAVTTYNFNKVSISASPTGVDDGNAIQPQAAVSGGYNSNANLTRIVRITAPNTIYYLNTETWLPSGVGNYSQLGFTATRIGSN